MIQDSGFQSQFFVDSGFPYMRQEMWEECWLGKLVCCLHFWVEKIFQHALYIFLYFLAKLADVISIRYHALFYERAQLLCNQITWWKVPVHILIWYCLFCLFVNHRNVRFKVGMIVDHFVVRWEQRYDCTVTAGWLLAILRLGKKLGWVGNAVGLF